MVPSPSYLQELAPSAGLFPSHPFNVLASCQASHDPDSVLGSTSPVQRFGTFPLPDTTHLVFLPVISPLFWPPDFECLALHLSELAASDFPEGTACRVAGHRGNRVFLFSVVPPSYLSHSKIYFYFWQLISLLAQIFQFCVSSSAFFSISSSISSPLPSTDWIGMFL